MYIQQLLWLQSYIASFSNIYPYKVLLQVIKTTKRTIIQRKRKSAISQCDGKKLSLLLILHTWYLLEGSKGLTNFYCCKLCTFPFFITFPRAVFASSSVSTVCPSSKVTLCILNCKEKEKQLASKQKQRKSWKFVKTYMNSCGWIDTCAPWRTRTSIPLLSNDMIAASSTSVSADKSSLSSFEKAALSSYNKSKKSN